MHQNKPRLSQRDQKILQQARRHGVMISFKDGATVFSCGGRNLPRLAVLRLAQLEYLVPGDGGLFGDTPQMYLINVTQRFGNVPIGRETRHVVTDIGGSRQKPLFHQRFRVRT
jgi:hypothetical protein